MCKRRAEELFEDAHRAICAAGDRLFIGILALQWLAATAIGWHVTPQTWLGPSGLHGSHGVQAMLISGVLVWPVIVLVWKRPGTFASRLAISIAQALTSSYLIHLTGGRIETHFHIFGSLAFLSLYRDWRVLVTASCVIALDHFVRGNFLPQSVFGMHHVEPWRWLEHTGWVVFTDAFLIAAGRKGIVEMRRHAHREAAIEQERDTFEQRVVERTDSLARSEQRFRCLSEASPVGVFHLDEAGRCVYVNSRWEQLFGATASAFSHWTDVLHPDDRLAVRMAWDEAIAEGRSVPEYVCRFSTAVDAERWVAVRAEILADGSALTGYVGIAADITEPKRAEIALGAAKRAAESANAVKSEFLAHMSHEMRTPLNGILGMTALTLEADMPAEQRESLQTVQSSAEALLTLVNDVLDYSRLEASRLQLRPQPFGLRETIDRALRPLAIQARQAGLEFTHGIDANVPDRLCGDVDRLRQVLINLVANAIKFTPVGGVDVTVGSQVLDDGAVVVDVAVADTGIGIPTERQRAIFAPFEQVDGSLTRAHEGVGLGLAIADRLVTLMGGAIGVQSVPGRGSTFRFSVRVAREAPQCQCEPARSALREGGQTTRLRVLVAEDNAVNRLIATRMLTKLGHAVVAVENGRQAVAAVEEGNYDAVLMDVQMPDMDGLAATVAVRAKERRSGGHQYIVAVTAHASPHDRDVCLEAGMDRFLTKPLHLAELRAALDASPRSVDEYTPLEISA